jgi:hypothetical protein
MLENYYFAKKTYPAFKKEVKIVQNEEKIIILWENGDTNLIIISVFNDNFIVFIKEKDNKLTVKNITLPNDLKIIEIPLNDFQKYVLKLKNKGIVLSSQHIVEFLNTNLRGSIAYYGLSHDEVTQIFDYIIIQNKEIFKNNPPATVVEDINNKWID